MLLAEPGQLKGMEFSRVYLLGLEGSAYGGGAERARWVDDALLPEPRPPAAEFYAEALRARRAYVALSRAADCRPLLPRGDPDRRRPALAALRGGSRARRPRRSRTRRSCSGRPRACTRPTG